MEKKQKIITILCILYGIWHFGTNWTTTLLSFLQWDTTEILSIVDLAYIQGNNQIYFIGHKWNFSPWFPILNFAFKLKTHSFIFKNFQPLEAFAMR
jgi:hypothetical protein